MAILVLNPGSTTLKAALIEHDGTVSWKKTVETWDLGVAARDILTELTGELEAIGCRVVHGGEALTEPIRVTDAVTDEITHLGDIAPLHNFGAAAVLRACMDLRPEVDLIAVFDTAFHHTMPPVARTYAISSDIAEREHLRRYGFHGISHQSDAEILTQLLTEENRPSARLITCHLGGGASLCAVLSGHSVDTTMGFSPLEGLMMATRSGDIDPGAVLYLMKKGWSTTQVEHLLTSDSGLQGVSGMSADPRVLFSESDKGNAQAALALELYAYRVAKGIASFTVPLGGLDGLAFSGGVGQNSKAMRALIVDKLQHLGIVLDQTGAADLPDAPVRIHTTTSTVGVWAIPSTEEHVIATQVRTLLTK